MIFSNFVWVQIWEREILGIFVWQIFHSIFSVFSILEKRYCPHYSVVWCSMAFTASGVGRSCSFMAQSIAYDLSTSTKKGLFLGPILDHAGRFWSPNSFVFLSVCKIIGFRKPKRNETETIFEFRPKTETKIETSLLSCFDLIRVFMHQICIKMTLDSLINSFLTLLNLHLP